MDRVYKAGVPELRKALRELHGRFSKVRSTTDWAALRVAPVLRHAAELEKLLKSRQFSAEISRLNKGVALFHSDLVYLRTNVKELKRVLESEMKHAPHPGKRS